MTDTLHPRLRDPRVIEELRRAWTAGGASVRIESFLSPGLAETLAEHTLAHLPLSRYHLPAGTAPRAFFWRAVIDVTQPLAYPLDRARDLVFRDLPALALAITGRALAPPEPVMGFCLFDKGCYLDPHDDRWDGAPATGWVIGLTRTPWPEAEGGHLTFFAEDRAAVVASRPPGWDTLDLYDVHPVPRWHEVPMLTTHRRRVTLSGLLTERA